MSKNYWQTHLNVIVGPLKCKAVEKFLSYTVRTVILQVSLLSAYQLPANLPEQVKETQIKNVINKENSF